MQGICDRGLGESESSFQVCDLLCSKVTSITEKLALLGTGKTESLRDSKQSMHQFSALLVVKARELGVKGFLVVSKRESRVATDGKCAVSSKTGDGCIVVFFRLFYELTNGKVIVSIKVKAGIKK